MKKNLTIKTRNEENYLKAYYVNFIDRFKAFCTSKIIGNF